MQSRGVHPSRPGCYFASSFVEKLYVTAMSPAKAQPIAPAGVGARATPARVRALAQILTGFGSAATAEDMDSDSRSASTSFFMISPFFSKYTRHLDQFFQAVFEGSPAPRPAERRSFDEEPKVYSAQHTPPPIPGQKLERTRSSPGPNCRPDGPGTRMSQSCCVATSSRPGRFRRPSSIFFFATCRSLVHNLGASDWLAFLFSL